MRALAGLAALLLLGAPASAQTEVHINVAGEGAASSLPSLELPGFSGQTAAETDAALAARLREAVRSDLLLSRRLDLREDAPPGTALEWRLEVKTGISADKLAASAKLIDLRSNEASFERYYKQDARFERSLAHKISDDVVEAVTGKRGIARTRIAFANDQTGKKEIYIADYDGANLKRLTGHNSISLLPRFAPDKKRLAYTSYKNGNPDLFWLDLETGKSSTLSAEQGLNVAGGFSPDGAQLLMTLSRGKSPNLFLKNLADGTNSQITQHTGADSSPTFSPDGGQVAFVSDRSGNPQIYLLDLNTRRARRLTNLNWCDSPAWSPTGEWIAFAGRVHRQDKIDVFLVDVTGGQIRQLTRGEGASENPAWSPDGRFIAYTLEARAAKSKRSQLYVMDSDGSAPHRIADLPGSTYTPAWSQ